MTSSWLLAKIEDHHQCATVLNMSMCRDIIQEAQYLDAISKKCVLKLGTSHHESTMASDLTPFSCIWCALQTGVRWLIVTARTMAIEGLHMIAQSICGLLFCHWKNEAYSKNAEYKVIVVLTMLPIALLTSSGEEREKITRCPVMIVPRQI